MLKMGSWLLPLAGKIWKIGSEVGEFGSHFIKGAFDLHWEFFLGCVVSVWALSWNVSPSPPKRHIDILTLVATSLFGNGVFAHVIRLGEGHTEGGWALIQYNWCLYEKRRDRETQGERHVSMEAEIRGTCLRARHAKNCRQTPEAKRKAWILQTDPGLPTPGFQTSSC